MKNLLILLVMLLCFSTAKAQRLLEGKVYFYEVSVPSGYDVNNYNHVLLVIIKDGVNPKVSFAYWNNNKKVFYYDDEDIFEIPDFYTDFKDCVNQKFEPIQFDKEGFPIFPIS
jgi:hypothetical protein